MDIRMQIKSLLTEAELYCTQGLFAEAKNKYEAASALIQNIDRLKNKDSLLKTLAEKIQSIEKKTEKVETSQASPKLSEKEQKLIKRLSSENDLEKVVALTTNDQSDENSVPINSDAVDISMPEPEQEILDITSIGITIASGTQKGKMVEFDVNFQSGDMLSLIVSKKDKGLIDGLKDGDKLDDIQFYSPIAMFKGTAIITNKTQINSGPKQGDYCLDLKVTST